MENNQEVQEIKFCVLGGKLVLSNILGGKYGSALAYVLQQNPKNIVQFLVRRQEKADEINNDRTSKKISETVKWNENVSATTDFEEAVKGAKYMLLCIPAQIVPIFLEENLEKFPKDLLFINCAKGSQIYDWKV